MPLIFDAEACLLNEFPRLVLPYIGSRRQQALLVLELISGTGDITFAATFRRGNRASRSVAVSCLDRRTIVRILLQYALYKRPQ